MLQWTKKIGTRAVEALGHLAVHRAATTGEIRRGELGRGAQASPFAGVPAPRVSIETVARISSPDD